MYCLNRWLSFDAQMCEFKSNLSICMHLNCIIFVFSFDLRRYRYLHDVIIQFTNYKMQNRCLTIHQFGALASNVQHVAQNIRDYICDYCLDYVICTLSIFHAYTLKYKLILIIKQSICSWNCCELFMIDQRRRRKNCSVCFSLSLSRTSSWDSFSFQFHLLFMLFIISPVDCQSVGRHFGWSNMKLMMFLQWNEVYVHCTRQWNFRA